MIFDRKILLTFLLILAVTPVFALTSVEEKIMYEVCTEVHTEFCDFACTGLVQCNLAEMKYYLKAEKEKITNDSLTSKAINYITKEEYPKVDISNLEYTPNQIKTSEKTWIDNVTLFHSVIWLRDRDDIIDYIPCIDILGERFCFYDWFTWSPTTLSWINPSNGSYLDKTENIDIDANDTNLCNISWRYENSTHNGDWVSTIGNWTADDGLTCTGVNCDCINSPYLNGGNIADPSVYNHWVWEASAWASNGEGLSAWGTSAGMGVIAWNNFPYDNGTVCDLYLENNNYVCNGAGKHFQNVNFSFDNNTWWNFTLPGSATCGEFYYTGQTVAFNSSWSLYFKQITTASAGFDNFRLDCGSEYYNSEWDTTAVDDGEYGLRIMAVNGTGDINITETINITIINDAADCVIISPINSTYETDQIITTSIYCEGGIYGDWQIFNFSFYNQSMANSSFGLFPEGQHNITFSWLGLGGVGYNDSIEVYFSVVPFEDIDINYTVDLPLKNVEDGRVETCANNKTLVTIISQRYCVSAECFWINQSTTTDCIFSCDESNYGTGYCINSVWDLVFNSDIGFWLFLIVLLLGIALIVFKAFV
jgi:hypothetical protein